MTSKVNTNCCTKLHTRASRRLRSLPTQVSPPPLVAFAGLLPAGEFRVHRVQSPPRLLCLGRSASLPPAMTCTVAPRQVLGENHLPVRRRSHLVASRWLQVGVRYAP